MNNNRTYLSSNGESISFSEEQLKQIVDVKIQLQNASGGRKCNWRELKLICEEQYGIDNIEVCENFRCLVKRFQSSIGELPNVTKFRNLVQDDKIAAAKALVGDIAIQKQEVQTMNREFNKVKREIITMATLVDEVRSTLIDDVEYSIPVFAKAPRLTEGQSKALILASDWHIGLDIEGFNYEIAQKQIEMYVRKILLHCEAYKITDVMIAGLGDLIEHLYMRPTQGFTVNMTVTEQVSNAAKLMITLMTNLAQYLNVEYIGSVAGNHSRMFLKGQTADGDTLERLVHEHIVTFIEMSSLERLTYNNCMMDNKAIGITIKGKKVKLVHGDMISHNNRDQIKKEISKDNELWDLLCYGHLHSFNVGEENHGRQYARSGCLPVSTDYAKDLGFNNKPSQLIVLFVDEEIHPIRVSLAI